MIKLQAVSRGYTVPWRDFDTTVHSVFPEAANLRMGRAGRILTLVTADSADLPQGIRLVAPPGFSFEKELQPGDNVVCRNNILGDDHERLSIDICRAKRWLCKLPVLDTDKITPQVTAAWLSAWQTLNTRRRRFDTDTNGTKQFCINVHAQSTLAEIIDTHIRDLVDIVRNLDVSVARSVAELIGLGIGLTPSGDDFLVGFLVGLHCTTGGKAERQAFLSQMGKKVIRLSHRTNDISRTYLFHAAHGQASSRLVALVNAIAGGEDSDRMMQITNEAMQVGHSSGMESVAGLLYGVATWWMSNKPLISQSGLWLG